MVNILLYLVLWILMFSLLYNTETTEKPPLRTIFWMILLSLSLLGIIAYANHWGNALVIWLRNCK